MAQQYQPAYFQPPAKQGNGFGVTALVIGIISVVVSVIPILGFVTFVLGPLAIIFGIVGVVQANKPKGMAITGMVLGAASIVIAAIITVAFFGAVSSTSSEATSPQPLTSNVPVESDLADSEASDPAPVVPAPAIAVDAAQLLEDFEANEAAADLKYVGQTLEVTGSVKGVDTEFLDDAKYIVQLGDGSEFSFTSVNCTDVPTDQAAAVVSDSTITIRGVFEDGGSLGVDLKDCVVL